MPETSLPTGSITPITPGANTPIRDTARGLSAQELFDGYAALVTLVAPAAMAPTVIRDPADDAVLACALAARAGLIVSGDADLLNLKQFHGIDVVNAARALAQVRS
jgi:predicted nucleic acid-binding protein